MATGSSLLTTHSKAFMDGFHVTVVTTGTNRSSCVTAGIRSNNAMVIHQQSQMKKTNALDENMRPAPTTRPTTTIKQPQQIQKRSADETVTSSSSPHTSRKTMSSCSTSTSISISKSSSTTCRPPRLVRPSLSEQLASIGAQADSLTSQIRKTHGLDTSATTPSATTTTTPVCTFPANSFAVGRLECRFPSPVQFFRDRCEYTFHHPFEKAEIRMVMYYKGGATSTVGSYVEVNVRPLTAVAALLPLFLEPQCYPSLSTPTTTAH